jgi:hypothetical protein
MIGWSFISEGKSRRREAGVFNPRKMTGDSKSALHATEKRNSAEISRAL